MAITFDEIVQLVARFGNSVVQEEANMAAPFIGKGTIKKEKHTGHVGIVNLKSGGIASTRFLKDGATLPNASNKDIFQLSYHPKALFSRLSVPRIAALTAISKQDGVNLVREQMQTVGEDLGRTLGRALFAETLGTTTGDDTAAASIVEFGATQAAAGAAIDVSGYRVGQVVAGLVSTGPADLWGRVTAVNHNQGTGAGAGIGGTVTMFLTTDDPGLSATPGGTPAGTPTVDGSASTPHLAGTEDLDVGGGNSDNAIVSLLDAASSTVVTGTIGEAGNYSDASAANTPDYKGNQATSGGDPDDYVSEMDTLSANITTRAGKPWTHTVMSSLTLAKYVSSLVAQRRFSGGDPAEGTFTKATYMGKPMIADENMVDDTILFFNDKDAKLAVWRETAPDSDGKSAAMVSDSSFIYDTQLFGLYNTRITKRSCLGKLSGL